MKKKDLSDNEENSDEFNILTSFVENYNPATQKFNHISRPRTPPIFISQPEEIEEIEEKPIKSNKETSTGLLNQLGTYIPGMPLKVSKIINWIISS